MLNKAEAMGSTGLDAQLRIAKRNVLILTVAQAILAEAGEGVGHPAATMSPEPSLALLAS